MYITKVDYQIVTCNTIEKWWCKFGRL